MSNAIAVASTVPDDLAAELSSREKLGMVQVTVARLTEMLRELGYRFDKSMAHPGRPRYVTGERAGESYPSMQLYPVQIDDGKSYAHFQARRDANFERLKEVRNTYFAVHNGRIYEW